MISRHYCTQCGAPLHIFDDNCPFCGLPRQGSILESNSTKDPILTIKTIKSLVWSDLSQFDIIEAIRKEVEDW